MKKKLLILGMVLVFSAIGTSASAYFNKKEVSKVIPSGYLTGYTEGNEGYATSKTTYARSTGNAGCGVYVEACIGSYEILKSDYKLGDTQATISVSGFKSASEHHSSHYSRNSYETGTGMTLRVR